MTESWNLRTTIGALRAALTFLLGLGVLTGYTSAAAAPAPPPIVSSVDPTSGPVTGGTPITIQGANFAAGANVTIGSTEATNINVVNTTTITATTPVGLIGVNQVWVQNKDGQNGYLAPSSQCVSCGFYYQPLAAYPVEIVGRVKNSGTPVAGLSVSVTCSGGPCAYEQLGPTAVDGYYTILAANTPPVVAVSVAAPNTAGVNSTTAVAISPPQNVSYTYADIPVAPVSVTISGTVTDACTGAALNQAGVNLTVGTLGALAGIATSDSAGHYSVTVAPGVYSANVTAGATYATNGFTNVSFGSAGPNTINFRMQPTAGCPAPSSNSNSSSSNNTSSNGPALTPATPGATPASGSGNIPANGGNLTIGNMSLTIPSGDLSGNANVTVTANPSLPFAGGGAVLFSPNGTVLDIAITDANTGQPSTVFPQALTLTFQITPSDLGMAAGDTSALTLLFQVDANTPPGENPDHLPIGSLIVLPAGPCSVDTTTNRMTCQINFLGSKLAIAARHTAYVQNFVPNAPLWSGPDAAAIQLNTVAQFTTFLVAEPQVGGRILVFDYRTHNYAWVDAANVGPSGPPKAP